MTQSESTELGRQCATQLAFKRSSMLSTKIMNLGSERGLSSTSMYKPTLPSGKRLLVYLVDVFFYTMCEGSEWAIDHDEVPQHAPY
jgi:hypothetical protein